MARSTRSRAAVRPRHILFSALLCLAFFAAAELGFRALSRAGVFGPQAISVFHPPVSSWKELIENPSLLNERYGILDVDDYFSVDGAREEFRIAPPPDSAAMRIQTFALDPPADCCRILFLGGSSVHGYPLAAEEAFAARVQVRLEALYGPGRVEVINGGVTCGTTATCRKVLERVGPALRPDVVVVYAGHNEYYPLSLHFSPEIEIGGVHLLLQKLYLHSSFLQVGARYLPGLHYGVLAELEDEMFGDFRATRAQLDNWTEAKRLIEENYRANLIEIGKRVRELGAPVLYLSVTSNLRQEPEFSVFPPEVTAGQVDQFEAAVHSVARLMVERQPEKALELARSIRPVNPDHLYLNFLIGSAYQMEGRLDEALESFRRARDSALLTYNGARAPTAAAEIVRDAARETDQPFLNTEEALLARVGGIGNQQSCFADRLHFSREGNDLVASLIIDALGDAGLLPPVP